MEESARLNGCHSNFTGNAPRSKSTTYIAHPWSKQGGVEISCHHQDIDCGHSESYKDSACNGCFNVKPMPG